MATGAADGFFRYVYDGCLSGGDMGIERRPYHRNCQCALHKNRENCPHAIHKSKNVKYPIRRSWSEGCLALAAYCHPLAVVFTVDASVGGDRTEQGLSDEEKKQQAESSSRVVKKVWTLEHLRAC